MYKNKKKNKRYIIYTYIYIFYSSFYSYTYTRGIWYINRDSFRIFTCNIAYTMSGTIDESIQRDGNGNVTSAFRSTSTPPTSSTSIPPPHMSIPTYASLHMDTNTDD